MKKNLSRAGALSGLVLMTLLAVGARHALADDSGAAPAAACGTTDNPCPLQKWMRANMGSPLAAGDTDALAKAFDHVAGTPPDPSWTTWKDSALAGSKAAAAKDTAGIKAACKSCHDGFKDKLKSNPTLRARPYS